MQYSKRDLETVRALSIALVTIGIALLIAGSMELAAAISRGDPVVGIVGIGAEADGQPFVKRHGARGVWLTSLSVLCFSLGGAAGLKLRQIRRADGEAPAEDEAAPATGDSPSRS